jgi:hypothetical protein
MNKHNKLQRNGICWDCGEKGYPIAQYNTTCTNIFWKCYCGRRWHVTKDDMWNWIRSVYVYGCEDF